MNTAYSFLLPFIEKQGAWVAADWKKPASEQQDIDNVIDNLWRSGAVSLSKLLTLIFQVEPSWLDNTDFLNTLSSSKAIFVLPHAVLDDSGCLKRCQELVQQGRHIALQVNNTEVLKRIPSSGFTHLHLTASFMRNHLQDIADPSAPHSSLKRIVSRVTSHEVRDWLFRNDFACCDSNYLTIRNPAKKKKPDIARMKLLKLLDILGRDGDTRELELVFRQEPHLAYNLLRLVNSAAVGAPMRVNNFSQAITILGRRQLQRWLQLLIYANASSETDAPNPLMHLAAYRGYLLEHLCKSLSVTNSQLYDNAFIVGLFSLLDVLLGMSMSEILKELPLDDMICQALSAPKQNGKLGLLLVSVMAGSTGNFDEAAEILGRLGVAPDVHLATQISALKWAMQIEM